MLNEMIGSVVQVCLFALVPLIVWLVTARKEASFFAWIGLKKPVCKEKTKTLLITAIAAIAYITAMNLSMKILPEGITTAGSQFAGMGMAGLVAVFFNAFVRTALSEELLFRGFLLKRISNKYGFPAGNTIQALLFGLLHGIPFGLVTKSVFTVILLTLLPGLFGWFQGWLNEKQCDGSIVPSWLLHGCINFLTGILSL
ncbi:MAG: CPBP family intramembrane metalloprotease [Solobacterium sp.]|nr:CPBP family intramembrane metalloprotease [Solobacterium sp.]